MADPVGLVPYATELTAVLTALSAGTAYIIYTVRRVSKERLDQKKDRAEESLIEQLQKRETRLLEENERLKERLHQVELERNDAVGKVGKLSLEVEILTKQVSEMKQVVTRLGTNLDQAREEIHKFAMENVKLASHIDHLEKMMEKKDG